MAFGIDDALMTAAAGISLTDTVVRTIESYREKGQHLDIELLIEEVRVTSLQRIDEADEALNQLRRTLKERDVDLGKTLQETISETSFSHPFEAHRLKRIRRSFNALADAAYSPVDDIASLVRCRDQISPMGMAVVDSAKRKRDLHLHLLNAKSINDAIDFLQDELTWCNANFLWDGTPSSALSYEFHSQLSVAYGKKPSGQGRTIGAVNRVQPNSILINDWRLAANGSGDFATRGDSQATECVPLRRHF